MLLPDTLAPRGRQPQWILWAGKGTLAFIDQGMISGSNFVLSILLARWLPAEQYGAYTLAFATFLLAAGLHQGLLLVPMSVFGPALFGDRKRQYLRALIYVHVLASVPVVASPGLFTWYRHRVGFDTDVGSALAGAALATPFILLFGLVRNAFYVELSPGYSVVGGGVYCSLLAAGMWAVIRRGLLGPFAVFLLMAGAALAASGFLLTRLRTSSEPERGRVTIGEVWAQHWSFGRWELGTVLVSWIAQNVSYTLAGAILGMAEVGALKALTNLILPISQITVVLQRLAQPYLSGISVQRGHSAIQSSVRTITLVSFVGGFGYWALVTLFRNPLFDLLYGGKYIQFAYLAPWLTFSFAISIATYGFTAGLRAIQSPSSVFIVNCTSAAVAMLVGAPATRLFNLPGLIGAGFLGSITLLIAGAVTFRCRMRATLKVSHFRECKDDPWSEISTR